MFGAFSKVNQIIYIASKTKIMPRYKMRNNFSAMAMVWWRCVHDFPRANSHIEYNSDCC